DREDPDVSGDFTILPASLAATLRAYLFHFNRFLQSTAPNPGLSLVALTSTLALQIQLRTPTTISRPPFPRAGGHRNTVQLLQRAAGTPLSSETQQTWNRQGEKLSRLLTRMIDKR
ncbi:hypothetical protein PGTUg99_008686, partial [Puccinia graminis f. sp. tritici]